jgi:hypothetical protein
MRRIGFAVVLALSWCIAPLGAEGQPTGKVARIGYLSPAPAAVDALYMEAFRRGLRALRYVEGQKVLIEARYADGRSELRKETRPQPGRGLK